MLEEQWIKDGSQDDPTPIALILNGWSLSTDYEKEGHYEGVHGGGFYDYKVKERPDNQLLEHSLKQLCISWFDVAGLEIGSNTKPIAFTGRKKKGL